MNRFTVTDTPLAGLRLLKRTRHGDERGFLSRLFDRDELAGGGWPGEVCQVNETGTTSAGTVRGFHYQTPPHAEAKLVTCIAGRILDVAVDIRRGSQTFLQHFAVELSGENHLSLLIPAGFAHGYQALTDDVRMIYAHSAPYRAEAEAGLNVADPRLAIEWPLTVANLSARDQGFAMLDAGFSGIEP